MSGGGGGHSASAALPGSGKWWFGSPTPPAVSRKKTVRFNTIDIKRLKNLHFGEAQVEVFDDALILRDVRNEKGQYFDLEMKWDWRLRQFTVVDVVSTSDDDDKESGGQDQDDSSGDDP